MVEHGSEVTLATVLRSFIVAETSKDHCKSIRRLWETDAGHAWDILANAADREKLYLLRKAMEKPDSLNDTEVRLAARWLGEFGTQRKTLVPFTAGSYADTRDLCVSSWDRREVPVKELWVKQTDAETTGVLVKHKHNIADAVVELKSLHRHKPWDAAKNSPPIICLEWSSDKRKGRYWVLDGCHRAIAKAFESLEASLTAFVGTVEQSEECRKRFSDD